MAAVDPQTMGPVDVAIIVFEGNDFNGQVAPALADLQQSGTVHILDLVFIYRAEDGTTSIVELADSDVAADFESVSSDDLDLLSEEELNEAAEGLDPGSSALFIVWENTWAAEFATAVRQSGGRLAGFERIPHDILVAALEDLDADEA